MVRLLIKVFVSNFEHMAAFLMSVLEGRAVMSQNRRQFRF
jgi:hypothetical protein